MAPLKPSDHAQFATEKARDNHKHRHAGQGRKLVSIATMFQRPVATSKPRRSLLERNGHLSAVDLTMNNMYRPVEALKVEHPLSLAFKEKSKSLEDALSEAASQELNKSLQELIRSLETECRIDVPANPSDEGKQVTGLQTKEHHPRPEGNETKPAVLLKRLRKIELTLSRPLEDEKLTINNKQAASNAPIVKQTVRLGEQFKIFAEFIDEKEKELEKLNAELAEVDGKIAEALEDLNALLDGGAGQMSNPTGKGIEEGANTAVAALQEEINDLGDNVLAWYADQEKQRKARQRKVLQSIGDAFNQE